MPAGVEPHDGWPEGYARSQPGPWPLTHGSYDDVSGYPLYIEYGTTLAQRTAQAGTAAGQWQQLHRAVVLLGRTLHRSLAPLLPRAMRPCRCRSYHRRTRMHAAGCPRSTNHGGG